MMEHELCFINLSNGENQSCLVLDGDKATISRYEETVKSNAWYSFINGRDKDTTVEVLNSFTYPKDKMYWLVM